MKSLLFVPLFASSAFAYSLNGNGPAPVSAIIFTIIFAITTTLNFVWLIRATKKRANAKPMDIEQQNLVHSTKLKGVVASNINVSASARPSLLGELRQDENLEWAYENTSPMRRTVVSCLSVALFLNFGGFATALSFSIVFNGNFDFIFLSMWIPVLFVTTLMLAIVYQCTGSVIYAVTSKRLFIFSASRGCAGRTERVRSYDLEGIHQTTLTRRNDGTGTLTFGAFSTVDGAYNNPNATYGMGFAFIDVPNVTAVKDLVEQFKTLRKIQAGNQ